MKRNISPILFVPFMIWLLLALLFSRMGPPYQSLASILGYGVGFITILTIGFVIFWARFERAAAKLNTTLSLLIISLPTILLTMITSLIDPSGELLKTITAYSLLSGAGLAIAGVLLGALYLLFLLARQIWMFGFPVRGDIDDPSFFEEMKGLLKNILRPLGFALVRQDHQSLRCARFTRAEVSVLLSWDALDKVCLIEAYDKSGVPGNKRWHGPDLVMKCGHLREAEEFKGETTAKLSEWLVKKILSKARGLPWQFSGLSPVDKANKRCTLVPPTSTREELPPCE